jgi:hypothetical protein
MCMHHHQATQPQFSSVYICVGILEPQTWDIECKMLRWKRVKVMKDEHGVDLVSNECVHPHWGDPKEDYL